MKTGALILTINSGSTSVKLAAFQMRGPVSLQRVHAARHVGTKLNAESLLTDFLRELPKQPLRAISHRVVHGGERFTQPVRLDADVLQALAGLAELAPLHNPPALHWIDAAKHVCGQDPMQLAVFDTAFFASLPPVAARYALPDSMSTALGIRRYGFHGIAHEAMWYRWCELNPQLAGGGRLISVQLGGGCSIAAIERGHARDVSMGFSPLEGLVMATRSGDIDAAIVPYLERHLHISSSEVIARLNHEAGLLGVSGRSSDPAELLRSPEPAARFAVELYCYRARHYLGAYLAVLGGCDGIVFGGGVGEHVAEIRAGILANLQWAGIELDLEANAAARGGEARISSNSSSTQIHALHVDEEIRLANAALSLLTR